MELKKKIEIEDRLKYLEDEFNANHDHMRCLKHEMKEMKEFINFFYRKQKNDESNDKFHQLRQDLNEVQEKLKEFSCIKYELKKLKEKTPDNSLEYIDELYELLDEYKDELTKVKKALKNIKNQKQSSDNSTQQSNLLSDEIQNIKLELKKLKDRDAQLNREKLENTLSDQQKLPSNNDSDQSQIQEQINDLKDSVLILKEELKHIQEKAKSKETIETFVNDVFNKPIFDDKDKNIKNYPPEAVFIAPEICEEAIQKKPYEDFIPTISLHLDKSPKDINYDELNNLLGKDTVILDVERFPTIKDAAINDVECFSTILQIAHLSIDDSDGNIKNQLDEYVTLLKNRLQKRFKSVVGNLVKEPEIHIPDDNDIQNVYCRPSVNDQTNSVEFNKEEINEIKKNVLQKLREDKDMYNWKFIFSYEDYYNKMEEQIREDLIANPYEIIIVNKTIFANRYLEEYEKIKKQIPQGDIVECFLYHGTRLCNHQKILNEHFLTDDDKKTTKRDDGLYGKGIYATENPFYAAMYDNHFNILEDNDKANIICCLAIYNKSKMKIVEDFSCSGKPIEDVIKENYGINYARVSDSFGWGPIKKDDEGGKEITAGEFVFPNKFQIIPLCSLTVMRKDRYILWKDPNIKNNENSNFLKQLSKNTEVRVYCEDNNEDALKVIKNKRFARVKLITNGSGKDLIEKARLITGSKFICLVFARDISHMKWICKMENVLFTVYPEDFKEFAELDMNPEDILAFEEKLKAKFKDLFENKYKFWKINQNELLNFPERDNYQQKCILA